MKLFLSASLVLVLLGLLAYTIWYRMHKRKMRKCRCVLEGGQLCGCDPERIGQIWPIVQPSGTHPSIDGVKVLALVLTRCRATGTVALVKWEEKYVHPISRRWKMLTDPGSYSPNIELLLRVGDPVTVVQLMEKIRMPDGRDATSLYAGFTSIPNGTPEGLEGVLRVILRRRKARSEKTATSSLPMCRRELSPAA